MTVVAAVVIVPSRWWGHWSDVVRCVGNVRYCGQLGLKQGGVVGLYEYLITVVHLCLQGGTFFCERATTQTSSAHAHF